MLRIIGAFLALATAGFIYFYVKLIERRNSIKGLPQPPMPNKLLGHLYLAEECRRLFPPGSHAQLWPHYMAKKYNLGPVFYVDWWPVGPSWIFVTDPEISSQFLTTGQSLPKSPLETAFLDRFLGKNNMVSLENERWKNLRSIFNPGFSASHLMTLVPYIVDASMTFVDVIREKARTNELFEMEEIATRLTIDIIGKVVLDADFDSQHKNHPIVDTFRARVLLMPAGDAALPWNDVRLLRPLWLWLNMRKLDGLIGKELDRKVAVRLREDAEKGDVKVSLKERKRSVVDLALDAYQKTAQEANGGRKPVRMSASFRQDAIDQMKTFIFAGHDTTSSTIAYIYYFLHLHPPVQAKLVSELDTVFGAGCRPSTIAAQIKSNPHVISRLEYTMAIIKETLRLFPPASTLRSGNVFPNQTSTITDPSSGATYPIKGWDIWPVAHLIHRNPSFFPRPTHFIPERFLPSQTPFPDSKLFPPAGKDAWRPFEKGPRNCIGQELAIIETKIIVALTVKEFDFTAEVRGKKVDEWIPVETVDEYRDGRPGRERGTVEGHRVFQILKGSAKPVGGMAGRIRIREGTR